MSKADIEITLRDQSFVSGVPTYAPGEVVQGAVRITAQEDLRCQHMWLRLQARTEGRGDEDKLVVDELDVFQGDLRAQAPTHHTFHFRLPESPWSYAGELVNIIWEVECAIDIRWARDPFERLPIVMTP